MMNEIKWRWLPALLIAAILITGCKGEQKSPVPSPSEKKAMTKKDLYTGKPGTDQVGKVSVSLVPSSPKVENGLQAVVFGGNGRVSYRWERNGEVVPDWNDASLPAHSFVKGDTVAVVVESGGAQARANATVANTPPKVISVPFADPYVRHGVDIVADPQGVDVDGDLVAFRFFWQINGYEVVGNDSPVLPGENFRKGDRISLVVVPADNEGEGIPFNGSDFTVPNAPPSFVSSPSLEFNSRVYTYEVRAEDPDGDTLTYSLELAPSEMRIDGETGRIHWEIKPEYSGEHRIRIVAQDDEGIKAFQEFTLTLVIPE